MSRWIAANDGRKRLPVEIADRRGADQQRDTPAQEAAHSLTRSLPLEEMPFGRMS
jgi:hypothetical protein